MFYVSDVIDMHIIKIIQRKEKLFTKVVARYDTNLENMLSKKSIDVHEHILGTSAHSSFIS